MLNWKNICHLSHSCSDIPRNAQLEKMQGNSSTDLIFLEVTGNGLKSASVVFRFHGDL